MDFLEKMYRRSRRRAESLRPSPGQNDIDTRGFKDVLRDMAVIAEVKYSSPSAGHLGLTATPPELALTYERNGARAISCLTEPEFFDGKLSFLTEIRNSSTLPLLMKDFITDRRQIMAGRFYGADAFLLISEMLSLPDLAFLHEYGRSLSMDVLVEVHDERGLDNALSSGAEVIGINSRNLRTMKVEPERHERMIGLLPADVVKVAESGIASRQRLDELRSMGYDAALVGSALASEETRKAVFSCG